MEDSKPKNKKIAENLATIIISFVIVLLIYFAFIEFVLFRKPNDTNNQNKILGIQDEEEKPRILFEADEPLNEKQISISSGIQTNQYIFFDNINREYLEGTSIPNSVVELEIGNNLLTAETNPDGFFSFKLPPDILQFSVSKLSLLDKNYQIKSSYKFILILREYLHRTYFILEGKNEIFSLQLRDNYKNARDQFGQVENIYCIATLDSDINSVNFDIVEDSNVVIFPFTVESLDFEQNKYCAFRLESKADKSNLTYCKEEWRQYEKTLIWHTEQINEIFKGNQTFTNTFDFLPVYSDTIN
ncbi:hypothetical protein GF362_05830 [Candidatus Dojkabacteria bacterium]|nr:hypothetical protein [Candidatus Dojkabacteria bacterium]